MDNVTADFQRTGTELVLGKHRGVFQRNSLAVA